MYREVMSTIDGVGKQRSGEGLGNLKEVVRVLDVGGQKFV